MFQPFVLEVLMSFFERYHLEKLPYICFPEVEWGPLLKYKLSFLVALTPPEGKYPFGMVIFQDGYLSKELISFSKTNGWTIYLEQFETKLSPISEKQFVYNGELSRDQSRPTSFSHW